MALEDYCAACTYLKENADSYGKYYCERKGEDHYASDPKCSQFCEAYSRSNSARENMYDNSRSHSNSGCYLTTALCNILGYTDDNYYLQTLRTYRDKYLKQDTSNWPLLITYDTIGPVIAAQLLQDKNNKEIATVLFTKYITNAVLAIEKNKAEEPKNIYIAMTNTLAERYNINIETQNINLAEIDIASLGHARTRKKAY